MSGLNDKFKRTIKKFLAEFVVIAIICAGSAALFLHFEGELEKNKTELASVRSELSSLNGQVQFERDSMRAAQNSVKLYEQLIGKGNEENLKINRQNALKLIEELKDSHRISNITLSMTPIEDVVNQDLRKETTKAVSSTVQLNFKGLTDTFSIAFIEKLLDGLKGYARVEFFSITKEENINQESLQKLVRGEIPELVSVNLKFKWYGIEQNNLAQDNQNIAPESSDVAPEDMEGGL